MKTSPVQYLPLDGAETADLRTTLEEVFAGGSDPICFIHLQKFHSFAAFKESGQLPFGAVRLGKTQQKLAVFFDFLPVNARDLLEWARGLTPYASQPVRIITRPVAPSQSSDPKKWVLKHMGDWCLTASLPEAVGLHVGSLIQFSPVPRREDEFEPALITLGFGKMYQLLDELDLWRRQFFQQVNITEPIRLKMHQAIDELLEKPEKSQGKDELVLRTGKFKSKYRDICRECIPSISNIYPGALPKILLLGETGVGKTLIARNLARDLSGDKAPFIRRSIPEYACKEDDFEYDVFGFAGGSYNDAPDTGRRGALFERIGGIVFLDEIGDATPIMQQKLLAYLDDFKIHPKGLATGIFCPVFIIAATNRPPTDLRPDLLRRFSVRLNVPSLQDRKEEFPWLLDILMQNPSINPLPKIREVSEDALNVLKEIDFSNANFRLLEQLLIYARIRAVKAGRSKILKSDVELAKARVADMAPELRDTKAVK